MDERHYWAFLSYSHADRKQARWLHRALETYRVPRQFVGRPISTGATPTRFAPIFRDREELPVDADLGARLQQALARSTYLIVVCSPASARSPWVGQEIRRFKALHGESRVLCVIVGGEPLASAVPGREHEECFAPELRWHVDAHGELTAERAEPIAADLRRHKDGRGLALQKLLARMLEVELDDLVRRDARRTHNRLALAATGAMVLAVSMAVLALDAVLARDEARQQRNQAEGLVEFMVGDLQRRLEPRVRLDVLGAVADRAMAYYAVQGERGMDADAVGRRARVLLELGWIEQDRGNLDKAERLLTIAAGNTSELLGRDPRNPQRIIEHTKALNRLGQIALQRGDWAVATKRLGTQLQLLDALVARPGATDAWRSQQGGANANMGIVLMQQHRLDEALPYLRRGIRIQGDVARRHALDRLGRFDYAQTIAWLADAEQLQGDDAAAARSRLAEERIYLAMLAQTPDDGEAQGALAVGRGVRATLLLNDGEPGPALALAREAAALAETVLARDPGNALRMDDAAGIQLVRGEAALAAAALADESNDHHALDHPPLDQPALEEAGEAAARAEQLALALVRRDRTRTDWSGKRLGRARILGMQVAARRAGSIDACLAALAPIAAESQRLHALSAASPLSFALANTAARGDLLRGDAHALAGDAARANTDWTQARARLQRAATAAGALRDRASARLLYQVNQRLRWQSLPPAARTRAALARHACGGPMPS